MTTIYLANAEQIIGTLDVPGEQSCVGFAGDVWENTGNVVNGFTVYQKIGAWESHLIDFHSLDEFIPFTRQPVVMYGPSPERVRRLLEG